MIAALLLQHVVRVSDLGSLRAAVAHAKAGTRIEIAAGNYAGGLYATDLDGVVISAADERHPPVFSGAWQFQRVRNLQVVGITVSGVTGNAIDVDDGGMREKPAKNVKLLAIHIVDAHGDGTQGIKMAGVDDFRITDCTVERWGGCAVDLVGCHQGVVEGCRFEHGGGVGVQTKGGCADLLVSRCSFVDYGGRGVNLGGSTGIPYFRPPLEKIAAGARYEAKRCIVEGCTFKGGDAPVAFAGADACTFRYNTIFHPQKWALRILQETSTPDFIKCRNGLFTDNIVVFQSGRWFEGGVNVGPNTAPATFSFARNWWYCDDEPTLGPALPSSEASGIVGHNPQLDPGPWH